MLASVGMTKQRSWADPARTMVWSHDSTSEYAILCADVLLHLVPGDRDDVYVSRSLGGRRNRHLAGKGFGLPDGWDHHVSAVTHLVSRTP